MRGGCHSTLVPDEATVGVGKAQKSLKLFPGGESGQIGNCLDLGLV